MSNQRLSLDLEKNTDLADLVADKEPGDKLEATLSIVAKDDKTLTVDLEEVADCEGGEKEESDEEDAGETGEEEDSPAMKVARGE